MKKQFLLLAAAATLSASSALAENSGFYLKGNVGYAKFNNEKFVILIPGTETTTVNPNLRSKFGGLAFAVGGGYYFTDIIRADLMIEHFSNIQHKCTGTEDKVKLKSSSTAAMVNGYVDFADIAEVKFFIGIGLGLVKTTGKYDSTIQDGFRRYIFTPGIKIKTSNKIASAVHLGATTKVIDNVNVDLGYSWRDLGSVKDPKLTTIGSNFPYRGHHVTLGIRYDI